MRTIFPFAILAGAALTLAGCIVEETPPEQNQQDANIQSGATVDPAIARERQRAREEVGELRFVVDLGDRQLRLFQGDRLMRTEQVAVGSEEYPTPVGRWRFERVDINPDWTPPDSEWAEEEEPKDPGEEGNPMGRARMVFHQDYSIHGTEELDSLGTDESHGSVRVANFVALELARMLLKAGGAWDGDQWFADMVADPTRMHRIELEQPVEIEVVR
jgi:lipoprotein-anchoring transpeptidase ErfK/SrfK